MSTRRRRIRRTETHLGPSPREKAVAFAAAGGVVALTGLAIWAMRPGAPDFYGLTGGIANRQPKATWLVVLTVAALATAFTVMYRRAKDGMSRRARAGRDDRPVIMSVLAGIVVVAVGIGFVWPGGLLRQGPPPIDDIVPDDLPTSLPPIDTSATTVAGDTSATTVAGDTSATTVAGDTSATTVAGETSAPTPTSAP
jgi:hypothetical protein